MKPVVFWTYDDSIFIDDQFVQAEATLQDGVSLYVSLEQFEELNRHCDQLKEQLRALGIRWENKIEGTKDIADTLRLRYVNIIKEQKEVISSLEAEIKKNEEDAAKYRQLCK